MADGDQQKEGDDKLDPGRLPAQTQQHDQGDEYSGEEAEPKKVHCRMMAVYPLQDAETWRLMATEELRKLAPSFTHQISSDVEPPVIFRRFRCGARRQLDGALGDLVFRLTGSTGEFFNRPTIAIACVEIHVGINAGGIESKQPLHAAETLEDPSPIQQGQLSQAGECVADRDLILRLAVLLTQVELAQGLPVSALQPALDRHQCGVFVVEMIDQLSSEIGARVGLGCQQVLPG